MSSTKRLNIYATIGKIKRFKSIIKKKKKKHDETALLAKTNLDLLKFSTLCSLTSPYIKWNYFLLANVLRECKDMKEESINLKLHNFWYMLI